MALNGIKSNKYIINCLHPLSFWNSNLDSDGLKVLSVSTGISKCFGVHIKLVTVLGPPWTREVHDLWQNFGQPLQEPVSVCSK